VTEVTPRESGFVTSLEILQRFTVEREYRRLQVGHFVSFVAFGFSFHFGIPSLVRSLAIDAARAVWKCRVAGRQKVGRLGTKG
jgi:hypothetical protein